MLRKIFKGLLWLVSTLLVLLLLLIFYVRSVAVIDEPVPSSREALDAQVVQLDTGLYTIGNNWFRKSESGLYELYVEGAPFERGVFAGKLTQDLVQYQEKVFNQQINYFVPSEMYREVLKYFVGWFNRDLANHVPEEYKLEIYGISRSASHDFDNVAPAYQRMLNYHAAHDIGHALQNMSLVGCTSFAAWDSKTEDSTLLIGRNFDFYVGDEFARDKIIAFYKPASGYPFMMVTFGGMTGVLSGMNDQGLTVTINAAKSEIPDGSATPVSLVAREILQYASTTEEAYAIADKRKMFVSESFLIGSAKDGKASVIEKNPTLQAWVTQSSKKDQVICTNHFQSHTLGSLESNVTHMKTSASVYRWNRVDELMAATEKLSVTDVANILRNQQGLQNADIGLGNEKAINQLVAHHGIIFQPEKKLVWISAAPWQLGKFVCYDLNKIFALKMTANHEIYEQDKVLPADSFLFTKSFDAYVKFSRYRFPFQPKADLQPDSLVKWNPRSYHAYMLAGDYQLEKKVYTSAKEFYEKGLTLEIATVQEREHMEKNLKTCNENLQ